MGIFKICIQILKTISKFNERTSDGGNWNHSVSLPIILIKIKVDQMLPSSYISTCVPTNPSARKCVLIFYIIYVKS